MVWKVYFDMNMFSKRGWKNNNMKNELDYINR